MSLTCPNCQTALAATHGRYCPRCGADLSALAGSAAPAPASKPLPTRPTATTDNTDPFAGPPPSGPAAPVKPVHIQRTGSLFNIWFLGSVAMVVAGALCASEWNLRLGAALLAVGIVLTLVTAWRSVFR